APPQLELRQQHDRRRARGLDARPLDVHVPERVSVQPRRLRGGHRDGAGDRDLPARGGRAARRRPGRAPVTAVRIDRLGTYFVLCTFSLLALYPVLSILFLALHRKTDLLSGFGAPEVTGRAI